jgi:hypothetical protein
VDDSGGTHPCQRVDSLDWSAAEATSGKTIKIKGFPRDHKVRVFRVEASTRRTDWSVTNDPAQDSAEATQQACGFRWKLSSCTAKANKSRDWNAASAAQRESSAITLLAPF